MGIAAGVAPLTGLSVTPQWILLLISPDMLPPQDQSKIQLRTFFLQIDIQWLFRNLPEAERVNCGVRRRSREVGQWTWVSYHCIIGPITRQSVRVPWERQTQNWMCWWKEQRSVSAELNWVPLSQVEQSLLVRLTQSTKWLLHTHRHTLLPGSSKKHVLHVNFISCVSHDFQCRPVILA